MDIAAALRAFVRTVERGSVTAAARDLAVSQPAVTKHLRNLERHVGARLLERSSRLVRPTAQGQSLYEASREALGTIDAALEGVRRDMGAVEGRLRIQAPGCIGVRHLHPIVIAFQKRHPGVTVDLVLESRAVDLVHEGFDLAVKYGRPEGQDVVVRPLGLVRRILVAAPSFLATSGPVESPADLGELRFVSASNLLGPRDVLPLIGPNGPVEVAVRPVLRTNSAEVINRTLIEGHAAGPVQYPLAFEELASGQLVRLLPDYELRPTEAFLAYPSVRFMRPAVRAFTDFLVASLRRIEGFNAAPARRDEAA